MTYLEADLHSSRLLEKEAAPTLMSVVWISLLDNLVKYSVGEPRNDYAGSHFDNEFRSGFASYDLFLKSYCLRFHLKTQEQKDWLE